MKRLARNALIVALSLVATLLVLEVGFRLWLGARGEGHSSAARRAAYLGQLDWMRRAHGPIGASSDAFDEANEQDLLDQNAGNVLSPYIGYESSALLADYARGARYFASEEAEAVFDVVLLGGSVATIVGADAEARAELERILGEDPRLAGRPVRLHGQGRGGFKAPQTSVLFNMLLQLGWKPDLVLLLDGFNEVALANENRRMGAHPLYPSIVAWAHLTPETELGPAQVERLVEMHLAQSSARRILVTTLRWGLYRSALFSRLADALLSRPTERHARAVRALDVARNDTSLPLALRGPEPPADLEAGLDAMLRIWIESSTSLAGACAARDIAYLHVLQPTLHDPGAKPITASEERAGRISDAWKEGVVAGYPLLRERGAALAGRGVAFLDASRIFEERTDDLYYDSCHFTSPGCVAVARRMAERARELPDLVPDDH